MSFDLQIINGDLSILNDGTFSEVQDTAKLVQDISKIIVTPLGSNLFNPWYGCDVSEKIVGQSLPELLLVQQIQTSVSNSINILKQLQSAQSSTQLVSLAEQINTIKSITAQYNPSDFREISVAVSIYSKLMQQVQENFTLTS